MRHPRLHALLHHWPWPWPRPSRYARYRRWQGGHWEQWWIEACWSELWLDVQTCTLVTKRRPGTGFGTPLCEDWP